jgi:outer membrane receptor protein involved in Fe transport
LFFLPGGIFRLRWLREEKIMPGCRRCQKYLLGIVGAAVLFAGALVAQDLEPGLDDVGDVSALDVFMEEVAEEGTVSTATGYAQAIDRSPSTVFVLTREQIDAINPKHPADLLRYVPGFSVRRTGDYGYRISALGTSGPAANTVLTLVDGHRAVLPSIGGAGFEFLPVVVEELQRVEVVLGPQSAIYGSNAFSAVVNFITRRPRSKDSSMVTLRAGNSGFNRETVVVSSQDQKGQTRAMFQHEGLGGYGALATVAGIADPTYSRGRVMGRKVGRITHSRHLGEGTDLNLSLGLVDLRSDGLAHGARGYADVDSEGQGVYGTFDVTRKLSGDRSLQFRSTLYRITQDFSRSPYSLVGSGETDRGDYSLQNELRYEFGAGGWRFNTGAGFRHSEVTGYLIQVGGAKAYSRYLYANGERELSDRWVLFLGALTTVQDLGEDATSWKVSGLYRPNLKSGVRLSVGTSFKEPDMAGTSLRTINAVPTPGGPLPTAVPVIRSNTNVQNAASKGFFQIGYELRPRKDHRLKLDFYRSRYEKSLTFAPTGVIVPLPPGFPVVAQRAPANSIDSATVRGVTFSYERPLGDFRLTLRGYGQTLSSSGPGIDLGNVPNRGGSLLLEYRAKGRGIGGSLSLHGVGPNVTDQFSRQQGFASVLPGYGTVDMNLSKKIGEDTRLALTVNDLFDHRHLENGPLLTIRPPGFGAGTVFGRTAWVSLTRKF